MSDPSFVHLRLHTEYSMVDSVLRIKPLMSRCAELGIPAVAMTDHCNLFAMVKFYRAAQGKGLKPIIGADLWMEQADAAPVRFTALCIDNNGYRNLTELVTQAYTEGQGGGRPLVKQAWVAEHAAGLIVLSGAQEGDVGTAIIAGHQDQAAEKLNWWKEHFPDRYYLELQRCGRRDDDAVVAGQVQLAIEHQLPVVAVNDVRFLHQDDFEAHEVRVCIHDGYTLDDNRRPKKYSSEQYLKSPEQMAELFADLPEALENTVEIARRCNVELTLGENYLPDFPVPEGHDAASFLREESEKGLEARLQALYPAGEGLSDELRQEYDDRLAHELDVIIKMGFPGYFLIVADFIRWSRDNDVPVGPGRGSGAGSLVAYVLEITDLDPLEYDLLFERFLNPERISMPDFDIDFCIAGRDRVIDYVAQRYGREKVSQIITYGTMAAKAVVRDVGRVLGHPYGMVDGIAKLVPFAIGMTLDKALEESPELKQRYDSEEEVTYLIDMALKLEGLVRNAGKHAGGVVISPSKLTDFTPLYCEEGGGSLVTQFDKDDVEAVGLVKFDFLGLRTLTIINHAVKIANQIREKTGEPEIDIRHIPLEDPQSFVQLKEGETTALFQVESSGMRKLVKELAPDDFEDIVPLVALYRPGPLESGMVQDFVNRRHGREPVSYPHPTLEEVLKPTYGVILYQEQVMQIAQVLSGYSLGGADLLRRAMGKKKPEIMARERATFVGGAEKEGVDPALAGNIFDLIEKFAGYGFNKSHSAAYALVSYQTAWLKAHYPAAFMCATLSADMDHTDKIVTMIEECRRMKIEVQPPDVNASQYDFTVISDADGKRGIRYGLGAIKGVGRGAIEGIIEERSDSGQYKGLDDFCRRIDTRKANRRALEALIQAGALDSLGTTRAGLIAELPKALARAEQQGKAEAAGQSDLFGMSAPAQAVASEIGHEQIPQVEEWPERERLRLEKETLGLYLTGHPIEEFRSELEPIVSGSLKALIDKTPAEATQRRNGGRNVIVAGLIVGLRRIRGGQRVILTLDDRSAQIECMLFEEKAREYQHLLQPDNLLIAEGRFSYDEYSAGYRINPKELMGLEEARQRFARGIVLRMPDDQSLDISELAQSLAPHRSQTGCPVVLRYAGAQARADIRLGEEWRLKISEQLMQTLRSQFGQDGVDVRYPG